MNSEYQTPHPDPHLKGITAFRIIFICPVWSESIVSNKKPRVQYNSYQLNRLAVVELPFGFARQ